MEEKTNVDYRKKYLKYKTKYIEAQKGAGQNCSL